VERLDEFQEKRCEWFARREPLAEVPYESREALCMWFLCREPLAAALCPFEDELGEFEADRGAFEEPLREGPAGQNPRGEAALTFGMTPPSLARISRP
jgi:hypothetical protein